MVRIYTPFHEQSDDWQSKLQDALLNALIMISVVVALTVVLILLYKRRCYTVSFNI